MKFSQPLSDKDLAIQRWVDRLKSLVAATGLSERELGRRLNLSKSAVARYTSGERVTADAWTLAKGAIAVAEEEGRSVTIDLQELESIYEEAAAAHQRSLRTNGKAPISENDTGQQATTDVKSGHDEPPDDPPRRHRTFRRHRLGYSIGASILALGLIYGVVSYAAGWWPFEPKVWHVNVVDTYSATYGYPLGLHRYRNPDVPGDKDKDKDFFYPEGSTVPIVCQDRRRRLVKDPTTQKSSAVWNKTLDDWWVADLYTDSPKVSGDTPPLGIPTC